MPFVWTVNPYRGCEFGCKYCYARYAHEFMELRDPLQFERKIFAKRFDRALFRAELQKVKRGESVWIGTATDPYQPAERRYRDHPRDAASLRRASAALASASPPSPTWSRRDASSWARSHAAIVLQVNLTITTLDTPSRARLNPWRRARIFALDGRAEPSPLPGVRVTVLASPVMPLINDSEESLDAVCAAAKAAGAASFSAAPLFLKPCAAQVFLPWLEQRFPHLVRRYRERYGAHAYLQGHYPELIREPRPANRRPAQHGAAPHRILPSESSRSRNSRSSSPKPVLTFHFTTQSRFLILALWPLFSRSDLAVPPVVPDPHVELHTHAMDNLRFIRETMEQAGSFTAVAGLGRLCHGCTARWRPLPRRPSIQCGGLATVWSPGVCLPSRWARRPQYKARAAHVSLLSGPARKFALSFAPPLLVGALSHRARLSGAPARPSPACGCSSTAPASSPAGPSRSASSPSWACVSWRWARWPCSARWPGEPLSWPPDSADLHMIFGMIIARRFGG